MNVRRAFSAIFALLCAACHASPGSVTGTVNGRSMEVAETASLLVDDGGANSLLLVLLSSRPGLCDALEADTVLRKDQLLFVEVDVYDASRDVVVGPSDGGDFPVTGPYDALRPGRNAFFKYEALDKSCQLAAPDVWATKGTVTVDSIDADAVVAGSGEVKLESGDALSFSFSSTPCEAIARLVSGEFSGTSCK
jgi:hypothetical protein